jgi:glycosyltransferase involved in cell wall biosynthesis
MHPVPTELVATLPATRNVDPERSLSLSVIVPVYNERHVVEASLRRLLAVESPLLRSMQVVVVDDHSSDGSLEILKRVAADDNRVTLVHHEKNQGKGAAIQTGLTHVDGDVTIIHDADLEYNPADIPAILVPFIDEGADAVFGSRYMSAPYRRALMHRHTMVNKTLTNVSNWLTDLSLTDLETCYKAVKTELFKSIPIRSNDFRFEVELAFKLAKRRARVFEVPIRYLPRTAEEGKKIRTWDGVLAIVAMLRFWIIDDIYKKDEYGSHILVELERARRFNLWLANTIRPFVGDRVLEIGAGIGTLTNQFIPRDAYLASDINPNYLHFLRSYAHGKPYLSIKKINAEIERDFEGIHGQFDCAIMINVLEHVGNRAAALQNLWNALQPGGKAIILVPQHPALFGSLDEVLEHKLRYTEASFQSDLVAAGFRVERMFDFNRFSVPGWWLNARLLRKRTFSRLQLKLLDMSMPILRRIDRLFPWKGLSLIAVAVRD